MTNSGTPIDVTIKPRHPVFDLEQALARDWHSNDPFKTAFLNALSLTFPVGEKYFIDSVRFFQKDIADPKLTEEIRGFIGQEAIHRREHMQYNDIMCTARDYKGDPFEAILQARIDERDDASPYARLMETAAFEHLTAILAYGLLTDDAFLDGADPTLAGMWRWHAIEEAEHKAVTFDVYKAVGGNMEKLRLALPYVTYQFLKDLLDGVWMMLKANGDHRNPLVWARGINWLFGTTGVLRKLYPAWRQFQSEDFHPWDHDTRDIIEEWKTTSEPELLAA
jgi:predicted metal-dependent hydrolase